MIEYDSNSEEASLVFKLTFPFIKLNNFEDDYLVSTTHDSYRCAGIVIDILKAEFLKNGHEVPSYYNKAHLIIINKLLENDQRNVKNKDE